MSTKKIYIDPGHGGSDPGATNGSRKEKDDVLCLAKVIQEKFSAYDAEVVLTRNADVNITIVKRCEEANNAGADFFMSIHRNSGVDTATGHEIWIYSKSNAAAVARAERILGAICKASGMKSRGVKKGAPNYTDFGVNKYTKMPAMLVEFGFITNTGDNAKFDATLEAMADAVCKAIVAEFGIEKKPLPAKNTVKNWQRAAIADGYKFPKYGADGLWGSECEAVAKKDICKYHLIGFYNRNSTKFIQECLGIEADGKFGKQTKAAVIAWQKSVGLVADGIVGLNSWKKLLGV